MPPRQDLSLCTAPDGTRIAIASSGSGPPLVRAAHWLSHVEHDPDSPVWQPWLRALSRRHRYVRYDQRGCGLSDADVAELSLPAWVGDLAAVVDHLDLPPFVLLGMSQGAAVAIAYAVKHPQRVRRLVLCGGYAQGAWLRAADEAERLEAQTLVDLARIGWGRDNPAFRQVFTHLFIPDGSAEQHRWWNELERLSASPAMAARTLHAFQRIDVRALAQQVQVPTLVLHARGDARVPFACGRELAALIPGARFVPLDSRNHVLLEGEPAWEVFRSAFEAFTADESPLLEGLTPSEMAVMELVAQGLDNAAIARRLGKSEKTVRNQVWRALDKLGLHSRAEAIVRVRERWPGRA